MTARIAHKAQRVELPPHACDTELGALLHADHERHPQVGQQREQRRIGEAPIRRDPHPTASDLADDARHGSANHRACIALHAAFEHRRIIGPPIEGYSAPAHNERDDQQMLVPFDRPVDGKAYWPMSRELDEGLQEHRIRQVAWLQPFVVEQPRQAFGRRFLIAKAAGQLGLAAGLLVNDRVYKVPNGFALMAMSPGRRTAL